MNSITAIQTLNICRTCVFLKTMLFTTLYVVQFRHCSSNYITLWRLPYINDPLCQCCHSAFCKTVQIRYRNSSVWFLEFSFFVHLNDQFCIDILNCKLFLQAYLHCKWRHQSVVLAMSFNPILLTMELWNDDEEQHTSYLVCGISLFNVYYPFM
jgi:hypothetical protein